MSKVFRGLYPPLITPFEANGSFSEQRLRKHIDFLIENGVDGLCAGSSTGEFMTLTRAEWEDALAITHDQVDGRVPVLAGTADLSTAATVERSRFAEKLGYDGLLVISPWYQVHTDREIYAHFKTVRDAVSIPIMIYNNQPVTGIQLSAALLERMARDGIIQYLKDADSDPYKLSLLKQRAGEHLEIFYGHDTNALGAFAVGATGWVSGTANFDPDRWSRLIHLCIDDADFIAAQQLWYEMLPFIDLTVTGENGERADWIAVIKKGLEFRGRPVGNVRQPMLPLLPEVEERLREVVLHMGFDELDESATPQVRIKPLKVVGPRSKVAERVT